MHTERDSAIVDWVGRIGAAGAEHVMRRFGMGRSWTYTRLSRQVANGLLEERKLLYRQPGLYVATAEGLRMRGLSRLGVYRVSPGGFVHARELAATAAALHVEFPDFKILAEREFRLARERRARADRLGEGGGTPRRSAGAAPTRLGAGGAGWQDSRRGGRAVGQGTAAAGQDLHRIRAGAPCRPRLLPGVAGTRTRCR